MCRYQFNSLVFYKLPQEAFEAPVQQTENQSMNMSHVTDALFMHYIIISLLQRMMAEAVLVFCFCSKACC